MAEITTYIIIILIALFVWYCFAWLLGHPDLWIHYIVDDYIPEHERDKIE